MVFFYLFLFTSLVVGNDYAYFQKKEVMLYQKKAKNGFFGLSGQRPCPSPSEAWFLVFSEKSPTFVNMEARSTSRRDRSWRGATRPGDWSGA